MKHAGIEYGIEEEKAPDGGASKFRWSIYPKMEDGPKVVAAELYPTWEEADKACRAEIEVAQRANNA